MGRSLTAGEILLARDIFGGSINYSRVVVHNEKYAFFQPDNSGMTPNGEIYIAGIYSTDYSTQSPQRKAFFIHEMVHVWQYQIGVFSTGVIGAAIWEMITEGFDYASAYPYVLNVSRDLTDYDLEQQASIIEDYFRLTRLSLEPRRARLPYQRVSREDPPGTPTRARYEKVLSKFLRDPTYGKRTYSRVCAPGR